MILPYKVYTVCGRALEDVYSSKGGSLRTGGDFRCFHLDVAGFYRLLEMMVAFGRVVDQVAEFEAFLIRMIPATVPLPPCFCGVKAKPLTVCWLPRSMARDCAVLSAIFHPFLTSPNRSCKIAPFSPFRMATAFSSLFPIRKGALYSVEPADGSVPSVV